MLRSIAFDRLRLRHNKLRLRHDRLRLRHTGLRLRRDRLRLREADRFAFYVSCSVARASLPRMSVMRTATAVAPGGTSRP